MQESSFFREFWIETLKGYNFRLINSASFRIEKLLNAYDVEPYRIDQKREPIRVRGVSYVAGTQKFWQNCGKKPNPQEEWPRKPKSAPTSQEGLTVPQR